MKPLWLSTVSFAWRDLVARKPIRLAARRALASRAISEITFIGDFIVVTFHAAMMIDHERA
jgi:hypothetical protein